MTVAESDPGVSQLYEDFAKAGLLAWWTQREDLMSVTPQPAALAHMWPWAEVLPLAERAGALVPVGRGGERRAIAYSNPGLPGLPYATPTLWAAAQYLGPNEVAPAHRHSQGAFRFVMEGVGVWTVVDGDPVAMRRGDHPPHAGLDLARAPQHGRPSHGVARRARHPARGGARRGFLRVRSR